MAIKRYKPTSAGRRGASVINYREVLTATSPVKALTKGRKRAVGRNNQGRITVRHKGGGNKRLYRQIDFRYDKREISARIETIEYDPNRSAFIASVVYHDGERRYILASQSTKVGDTFVVSETADVIPGNRVQLKRVPVGTFVYNVEIQPEGGAKLARGAGVGAEVLANEGGYTNLRMPSSEVRKVHENAWATIGSVSNPHYNLVTVGKAGRSRHMGIRPTVRGSAMNPVDHPHGGGEGRQGIGLRRGPKTPWGKQALGVKTRKPKKYSNTHIVSRRKTGKKRG
ncbi:MAG: 50S ribosomal protein L2 [bacterium]|nr:50S ribosomal protein L2 [bacterium]